jgi:hypothetical protein
VRIQPPLPPGTAVGFTQQVKLSPCVLEWLPVGRARDVIALRRAERAVQGADSGVVTCVAGNTADETGFHGLLAGFGTFSRDAVYPHATGARTPVWR